MSQLFTNNAWSSLNGNITAGATSIVLTTGTGDRFPAPSGEDFFLLTIIGLNGAAVESSWEIVKVTARSGDTLTVERGQEGTTAVSWLSGTRVELRLTAGQANSFDRKVNVAGDSLLGPLEYNTTDISVIAAATTNIGAADSNVIIVNGTATITRFDAAPDGAIRILLFADPLTLVHESPFIVLPGDVDIVTAASDVAVMLSLGGNNWQCIDYQRADGKPVVPNTTALNIPHTWAVSGEVKAPAGDLDVIPGFFVPSLAAGQTAKLVEARHKIGSGTSATVKLQKNGVDITGFTGISVTPTGTLTNPADIALATGDYIQAIVTAVSGTPKNMSFTVGIEYAAAGV